MKNFYFVVVLTLFVSSLMAQNVPSYVPKDSLVGFWPFNGNAKDESGNGNHGTVNGATLTSDRNGKANSAYSFDGSNKNYIQINSKVGNFGTLNFTISLWVLSSNKISSLINKRYNEEWGNFWELRSDFFCINDDDKGINKSVLNNLNYEYNNWNNIIIIREKSKLKYYYNGKLINEVNTSIINNIFNDNNLIIGTIIAPISGVLQSHYGIIDDIAIYNRALTEAEVQALYTGDTCPINAAISTTGSVKICEGSALELKTTTDTNYSFQWFKDNQPISGATSKSYKVTKAGQYALSVSDPVCTSMSPITIVDTIPLPATPTLFNTYQKVCGMEPINMITQRLTNYNAAINLKWYRNETDNDSISKYMSLDPYPRNYYVSQLSATSPQCESAKRTMVFIDVAMPASVNPKGNTTFCEGDSVVLEAFANGNQYDYAWKKEYNWIQGTEGKNTFVAKESGRYSYQSKMCDMQMGGNEIIVTVKPNLKVNVGKITSNSVEFVWDTLSLSPKPTGYEVSYSINSKTTVQKKNIPVVNNFTVPGLKNGDTVFISIIPQGTDCTQAAFATAVAKEIVIPNNIPSNGLVGYWPFNGNANDESGNGNHGTVNGAKLTSDRNGNENSAYNFDGNSNYINVNNSQSLNNSSTSISGWFNPNSLPISDDYDVKSVIGKWWQTPSVCDGNYNAYLICITKPQTETSPTLGAATNFYAGNVYYSKSIINKDKWYHFVFIHDSKTGSKLYVNSNLENSNDLAGQICNSINDVTIGADINNGSLWRFFNGKLDDIAIYNRALTEQEVKQLYGAACPKETATSSSFSYPVLTTNNPVDLSAKPEGGEFKSVSVEKNLFIPTKAKIGLNKVVYTFKNSQGCNDSTEFAMIVADTAGTNCKKYDTITITNNVTKYDTVKVTKYDTITIKNNVYDTVVINQTKYDTITVTNNVTKYDTITLTDTVSILKITFKLTTGIQANKITSMSLYPNPTTDVLHIEVGDAKALEGYRYRLLDALGKEVYNELVKNAITEIPLKTLGAAGLYQFEVLDQINTNIQTNKIVLQ